MRRINEPMGGKHTSIVTMCNAFKLEGPRGMENDWFKSALETVLLLFQCRYRDFETSQHRAWIGLLGQDFLLGIGQHAILYVIIFIAVEGRKSQRLNQLANRPTAPRAYLVFTIRCLRNFTSEDYFLKPLIALLCDGCPIQPPLALLLHPVH